MRSHLKNLAQEQDHYCARKSVKRFFEHVKHSLPDIISLWSAIDGANSTSNSLITRTIDIVFPVAVHKPSRMINITQLLKLAPTDAAQNCKESPALSSLKAQEVRGETKYEGRYIKLHDLEPILPTLEISLVEHEQLDLGEADVTPDHEDFSSKDSEKYLIVAHSLVAGVAYVDRKKHHVHWNGEQLELTAFINTYIPEANQSILGCSLDPPEHWSDFGVRQLQSTGNPTMTATEHDSWRDSSDDPLRFRPRHRVGPLPSSSTDRTLKWVQSTNEARTKRIRLNQNSELTSDIPRTVFTTKPNRRSMPGD